MKYNKLWQYIAENTDKTMDKVFKECNISHSTLYSMRNPGKDLYGRYTGGNVNLAVIDRLCSNLHCQPSDIMELDD